MKVQVAMRIASFGLIAIAIAAFGYCATVWWGARQYQQHQARIFDRQLVRRPAVVIRPPAPKIGGAFAKLEIPRIGVSVVVVEGAGAAELEHAVGHVPGTALPGERGNVALAGHRDTFFRPLASIHPGDAVSIATLQGTWRYQVVSTKVVRPADVAVLYPTPQDTLTLITCYPFHYVGAAPMRFIVRATALP